MAEEFRQFSRGDVISGRFEVEKLLGEGTLGATYQVRHIKSGKHLALKFMRPRFVTPEKQERFAAAIRTVRESAEAAGRPDGAEEGLVRYGDVGEHEGLVYFSQEFVPGRNLRELIDEYQGESRSFTLQEACQIVLRILAGLEQLHGKGQVHSHLKPENVLVRDQGTGPGGKKLVRTVKITDAGMARLLAATGVDDASPYRAPELGLGVGTPQSDVYSVGVILYELLIGQPPRGTYLSPTQLRGDLPEPIDDIVEIALAANAEDRYPSPRDMADHIRRTFAGETFDEVPGTSFRNTLIAVGIGMAVIALVGVYVVFRGPPDQALDNLQKDRELRQEIQARIQPVSEEEMRARKEAHPEMLYIPAGPVVMGRLNQESMNVASASEPLAQAVDVPAFYIDRFEFPNRTTEKPVAKASWQQASEACQQAGKRLCTEEEWEKACKGPANWIYSYGDTYDGEMCGPGLDDRDYTIGMYQTCVSGYGVAGMSGGPREWTGSAPASSGRRRLVKGGLRGNNERGTRCAFSVDESATYSDSTLSFRCCLDAADPAAPPAVPGAPAAPAAPPSP